MNKILKEQLTRCNIADVPDFEEDDLTLVIPKSGTKNTSSTTLEVGSTYLVELEDYIIHPPANFSLHDTWNNGIIPESKFLKATVIMFRGKMVNFKATCTNYDASESGANYTSLWVPLKSIRVRRLLNRG